MSDDAGADAKKRRGRPAAKDSGDAKPKAEKRSAGGDSGPPAKKGRGRPKGSGGRRKKGRKTGSPAKKVRPLAYVAFVNKKIGYVLGIDEIIYILCLFRLQLGARVEVVAVQRRPQRSRKSQNSLVEQRNRGMMTKE